MRGAYLSWLLLLGTCLGQQTANIENVYPNQGVSDALYTLFYDAYTGRSVVGGVNQLTILGPNLEPLHEIRTGPNMGNIECPPPWISNCTCKEDVNNTTACVPYNKIPIDSVVKTIALDHTTNTMVYCTSSYSGTCNKLNLDDPADVTLVTDFLINGDIAAPLVSQISLGPEVGSNFLYLASSWSERSQYRDADWAKFPMISALRMSDFKILKDYEGASMMHMKDTYKRQHFTVLYKYAFHYKDFNYFLMVQQKSAKSQDFESRIGRVCLDDKEFSSYTEVRLACSDDQTRYNVLTAAHISTEVQGFPTNDAQLFITFAQSYEKSYEPLASSALCIYKMQDVEKAFNNVIQHCYSGGSMARIGPDHFVDSQACPRTRIPAEERYCGMPGLNGPVEGSDWIRSYMQQDFQGTLLTGVTATKVQDRTLVFLATESGHISKVHIDGSRAVKYVDMKLEEGAAIQKDFYLSNTSSHLVILGKHKVYRVKSHNCDEYTDCGSCMKAKDVLCGWCLTNSRCGLVSDCDMTEAWVSTWDGSCPSLSSILPQQMEARNTLDTKVSLAVRSLPILAGVQYECVLHHSGTYRAFSSNRESATNIHCDSFTDLPPLPQATGSLTFDLYLKMNGQKVIETTVTIYNCSLASTCIGCTNSSLSCAWCSQSHRCTYASDVDDLNQCGRENYIYSDAYADKLGMPEGNHGAGRCPKLVATATSAVLPAGVPSSVQIIANNIQSHQHDMKCLFRTSNDEVIQADATVVENVDANHFLIYCKQETLYYLESQPLRNISVDVYWGNSKAVDNPSHIQVTLYKCQYLVSDCGHCLTLLDTYQCGWCHHAGHSESSNCSLTSQCAYEWLDKDQICPNPHITRFFPLSGPLSGGTTLTVNGVNLGKQVSDLQGGVKVVGVRCMVQDQDYQPSSSFVCITDGSHIANSGPIFITVDGKYSTHSDFNFTYVDPVVLELWPRQGPISGGTLVTVRGQYLNIGSKVKVTLSSKNAAQDSIRRNASTLIFHTPAQLEPSITETRFTFDRAVIPSQNFKYLPDPVIYNVGHTIALYSGGGVLEFEGTNLDSVEHPQLQVQVPDSSEVFITECQQEPTALYCDIPPMDHRDWNNTVLTAQYGLLMDGVESLRNLTSRADIKPLTYHPNPRIYPLSEPVKFTHNLQLIFKGTGLDVLLLATRYLLTVGGERCNITSIKTETITCIPPAVPSYTDANGLAEIEFTAGRYRVRLGYVGYNTVKTSSLAIILGVIFGVALPIIVVVILLFVCLRRQNKKNALRTPYKKDYYDDVDAEQTMLQVGNSGSRRKPTVSMPLMAQVSREDLTDDEAPIQQNGTVNTADDNAGNKTDDNVSRDSQDYDSLIPPKFLQNLLGSLEDETLRQTIEEVLIARDQLELGEVLGRGHFGRVYHGTLNRPDQPAAQVAVKTLQGRELDRATVESFLQEGMMMKNFDHQHVLKLLGVVISSGEYPMVVLPYMAKGDLRSYVKDKLKTFTARQLLGLAQQVAAGMSYLSKLNFVHRDLAARNCMIDENDVVKVADFGLSKDLYDKDYYASKDRKRKMPIKWMALESLEEYLFTTKSDVWSFGVLMWELLTRGITPYTDVDVFEVRNYLASGHRLRQPKYCPEQIYKIMLRCWAVNPAERPTFVDLVNHLELIIRPPKSHPEDKENDEPIYMNASEAKESKPRPRMPPPAPPTISTEKSQTPEQPLETSPSEKSSTDRNSSLNHYSDLTSPPVPPPKDTPFSQTPQKLTPPSKNTTHPTPPKEPSYPPPPPPRDTPSQKPTGPPPPPPKDFASPSKDSKTPTKESTKPETPVKPPVIPAKPSVPKSPDQSNSNSNLSSDQSPQKPPVPSKPATPVKPATPKKPES